MTKPPEPVVTGELKVTQADREAAHAALTRDRQHRTAESIKRGEVDKNWLVQAFARHRTAHALPGDVGMREALEKVRDTLRSLQPALNVIAREIIDDIIADQIEPAISSDRKA